MNNPPIMNYRLLPTYVNGGTLMPGVGKRFSEKERSVLSDWLRSMGCQVYGHGAGIKFRTAPGMRADELPDGFQLARDIKARETKEARKSAYKAKVEAAETRFRESHCYAWIVANFGEDFANWANKSALADYLDDRACEFNGLMSHKWVDGLLAIGIAEDDLQGSKSKQEIAEMIKERYVIAKLES